MTGLRLTFRCHPVNGWWLRTFTDPFADVDGVRTPCSWRESTLVAATPGLHSLQTYVRYRRVFRGNGGASLTTVEVPPDGVLEVGVRNGPLNQDPFVARVTHR